jgi:hypothetical protein
MAQTAVQRGSVFVTPFLQVEEYLNTCKCCGLILKGICFRVGNAAVHLRESDAVGSCRVPAPEALRKIRSEVKEESAFIVLN